MASRTTLSNLVQDAEDVAAGLYSFRDGLPRIDARITAIIGQLLEVSSLLRGIANVARLPPSVRDDLARLSPTLRRTLDRTLVMLGQSGSRSYEAAWQSLCDRMERDEGIGLKERLSWYLNFLRAQQVVIEGRRPLDLNSMRREFASLLDSQKLYDDRDSRRAITPLPRASRPQRPTMQRGEGSTWSYTSSGYQTNFAENDRSRDAAEYIANTFRRPTPPLFFEPAAPTSPTFTSDSSQTLKSSQTSQSGCVHWAQNVFDGNHPSTPFAHSYQMQVLGVCTQLRGTTDIS